MFRFSQLSSGWCLHEFFRAVVLHPTREQELRVKQKPPETKVPHSADSETLGLIQDPLAAYKVAEGDRGSHVRSTVTKKGKDLNEPRDPSRQSKPYTTAYYVEYDATEHLFIERPEQRVRELTQAAWQGYPLFADKIDNNGDIAIGCRLDDRTLTKLIDSENAKKDLNAAWPTEFDTNGMVRMPLGFTTKMYVNVGGIDRDGRAARAGWYYRWYWKFHLLAIQLRRHAAGIVLTLHTSPSP